MVAGSPEVAVVTGAFSYTGKYLTRRLLALGTQVKTITGHPDRPNEFGGRVAAFPFDFDKPDDLRRTLAGASMVYCTYWIRFSYGAMTYARAVENTKVLIRAAREAGVRRFVYVSITCADASSPLPYFRGKGELERAIRDSGMSYALVRPTVIYGPEDVLINNIAWCLRKFPVFALPGSGAYPLQPIFVEDMADLTVAAGGKTENLEFDAVGPETFTFEALVRAVAESLGSKARILRLPPWLAHLCSSVIGWFVGDVVLTKDEVDGLMAGLLVSKSAPTGKTRLTDWLVKNAGAVGSAYHSELARHYR